MGERIKALQVPSYIIHRRPYRETSAIIDVVCADYGRVHMVLHGAQSSSKTGKKSLTSSLAQPFHPLLLSFSGGGDLKTATGIEEQAPAIELAEKYLFCGFYLNELTSRLWPQNLASNQLYPLYHTTLQTLIDTQHQAVEANALVIEVILRRFEFELLQLLGYGVDCFYTHDLQQAIEPDANYLFSPLQGFVLASEVTREPSFSGKDILALGQGNLADIAVLRLAKQISRLALAPLLGDKPLKSRELFLNLN